jgi:hypothetical protein
MFVEALVAHDGEKCSGWPLPLSESIMMASPLLYDIGTRHESSLCLFVSSRRVFADKSGTLDVVVTTEAGEIVFVEQSGVPMYNMTLKIGPLALARTYLTNHGPSGEQAFICNITIILTLYIHSR